MDDNALNINILIARRTPKFQEEVPARSTRYVLATLLLGVLHSNESGDLHRRIEFHANHTFLPFYEEPCVRRQGFGRRRRVLILRM